VFQENKWKQVCIYRTSVGESVFQFLNDGDDHHHRYLEHLSLVSKQFLSITNRFRSSLTICDLTLPFLPRLLHRFPNLTSLDLSQFHGDLDELLTHISLFSLDLRSLNLSNGSAMPSNGLQALNEKMKMTLISLKCVNMDGLRHPNLAPIFNCFPFLQELDLSHSLGLLDFKLKEVSLVLPKLRKINLSGNNISDQSLFYLCKNCEFLEEIEMMSVYHITVAGVASAIRERPGLRCLSFTISNSAVLALERPHSLFTASLFSLKGLTCLDLSFSCVEDKLLFSLAEECLPLRRLGFQCCFGYSYSGIYRLLSKCQSLQHLNLQKANFLYDQHFARLCLFLAELISINVSFCSNLTESTLFAFAKNCPLLTDINMEETSIGKMVAENLNSSVDFVVSPQVKSLHLKGNAWLMDESIQIFATFFPNLELLDLSSCYCIFDGVDEVLRRGCNIKHLSLASSFGAKLFEMNFVVPKLEVLNLSRSATDDEALYEISKSCCGLLQLDLENCYDVTDKGVRQVVEKCR